MRSGICVAQVDHHATAGWPWPRPRVAEAAPARRRPRAVPPLAASRSAAASTTSSATSSRTCAIPRSTTIAAVMPARSYSPRPASQPPTTGKLSGSRRSKPLHASKYRAVSRTERVRQPRTVVIGSMLAFGSLRNPAVRRLQPEEAAEPSRSSDGAATIAARGDGKQAARHGGRGAPRRSARRALLVPWVPRRAVQYRGGAVDAAEFGRRRLRSQHRTRGTQPAHRCVVLVRPHDP